MRANEGQVLVAQEQVFIYKYSVSGPASYAAAGRGAVVAKVGVAETVAIGPDRSASIPAISVASALSPGVKKRRACSN